MPCVSPRTFDDWVPRGLMPKGIKIGSLRRWMWKRSTPHSAIVEGKMLDEEGETPSTSSSAMVLLDGAMNGAASRAYVEQVLVPKLMHSDIIVMGNLPAHKAEGVRQAIEVAGFQLLYHPPYSPDFNLIERPSLSSKRSSEREQRAPSKHCGTQSARSLRFPNPKNAPTTSRRVDMPSSKMDAL